jgi:hypothetical protein
VKIEKENDIEVARGYEFKICLLNYFFLLQNGYIRFLKLCKEKKKLFVLEMIQPFYN